MRATGTAADVMEACERVKQEFAKTYAELAPKTEASRQAYINRKHTWDIFRRNREYWATRWETSSSRDFAIQCNGTGWINTREEIVLDVERKVNVLDSFDTFTLSDTEITALSYIHS